jgi:hypothetical protein
MNRMLKSGIVALMAVVSVAAHAEDSKQRAAFARESSGKALNGRSVEVLRRVPGPGNRPVAERMLAMLEAAGHTSSAGAGPLVDSGGRVLVHAGGWALEAQGEGTRVRFQKMDHQGRRVSAQERPTMEQLQGPGEAFISNQLSGVVTLGKGETLVPFKTRYLKQGSASPDGETVETVTAATIVFARAIDGVPVLGDGSKAAVTFDMDGQVIGFDVDWAKLQRSGTVQATVDSVEVGRRHKQLRVLGGRGDRTSTIRRMECGYYDAGYMASRAGTLVQPACVYEEVEETSALGLEGQGKLRSAEVTAVPIGKTFVADEGLPEALKLQSNK